MSGAETRIERAGVAVAGHLAEPEGAPRAGVVVIQEAWGLNDNIRGIADRFAARATAPSPPISTTARPRRSRRRRSSSRWRSSATRSPPRSTA